jgi:hypothetical protein
MKMRILKAWKKMSRKPHPTLKVKIKKKNNRGTVFCSSILRT